MEYRFDYDPKDGGDWSLETMLAFRPPEEAREAARLYWLRVGNPDPDPAVLDATGMIVGIRAPQRKVEQAVRKLLPFSHALSLPPVPQAHEVLLLLSLGKEVRVAWEPRSHAWEAIHRAFEAHRGSERARSLLYGLAAAAMVLRPPREQATMATAGPWLTAAVMYAMNLVSALVAEREKEGPVRVLTRKEIQKRANEVLLALLRGDEKAPVRLTEDIVGPTNTIRFLWEMGRRLWDVQEMSGVTDHPAVVEKVGPEGLTGYHAALLYLIIEGARREAVGRPLRLEFSARPNPVSVAVHGPWLAMNAWHQFLEAQRWGTPPHAHLQFLFAEGLAAAVPDKRHRAYRLIGGQEESRDLIHTMNAFARALLRRAEEKGVYRPLGRYLVEVPSRAGLEAWGIRGLAVAATPESLYIRLITDAPGYGPVLRWVPSLEGERISSFLLSEEARAVLDATLAALWHDMVTEPEGTFREAEMPLSPPATSAGVRRTKPTGPRPRYFPRRVRLQVWGETEGRARRLGRRMSMHFVTGHLRRLPPGHRASEEARRAAEEHGIVLPEGFTYVRPHLRGGRDETVKHEMPSQPPEARPARFRGLRSLAALMRGLDRAERK